MAEKTENTLRIHVGLVLSQILCWPAFAFELYRALAGNLLSWAYVFEWPILACYSIYMWRRMLDEEKGIVRSSKKKTLLASVPVAEAAEEDPALTAWNNYLAQVHHTEAESAPE
jgi:ABC-type sugar transport system permease subunit